MNLVEFETPPPIGQVIRARLRHRVRWCKLVDVKPYVRQDGASSFILTWQDDVGVHYTSGLRSKSLSIVPHNRIANA